MLNTAIARYWSEARTNPLYSAFTLEGELRSTMYRVLGQVLESQKRPPNPIFTCWMCALSF